MDLFKITESFFKCDLEGMCIAELAASSGAMQ
jgi:hypothetical protein